MYEQVPLEVCPELECHGDGQGPSMGHGRRVIDLRVEEVSVALNMVEK